MCPRLRSRFRAIYGCGQTPGAVRRLDAAQGRATARGRKPFLMVTDPPYGIELDSEWRDRAGLNGCGPAEASYMKHRTAGHTETIDFRRHARRLVRGVRARTESSGGLRLARLEIHARGTRWLAADRLPASPADHLGQRPNGAHANPLLVPARAVLVRPEKERPVVRKGWGELDYLGFARRRNSSWAARTKRSLTTRRRSQSS